MDAIAAVKMVYGRRWLPERRCWSLPYTEESANALISLLGDRLEWGFDRAQHPALKKGASKVEQASPPPWQDALTAVEEKLLLLQYSYMTIKAYKQCLNGLFYFHKNIPPAQIAENHVRTYLLHLLKQKGISESSQNQIVNAAKFYLEQVLGRERLYIQIERPKRTKALPNFLSKEEVVKVLQAPGNLKHRCILTMIYSAGLRLGELVRLRVQDIRFDDRLVQIKDNKGKNDRNSILSERMLESLKEYLHIYQPKYWLFEGQDGGQYSTRSVQEIMRMAVQKSGVNPYATVHTLRHSFATHMVQNGVNLRVIQELLGHNDPKTTEIYTHIVNNNDVKSPLDGLRY